MERIDLSQGMSLTPEIAGTPTYFDVQNDYYSYRTYSAGNEGWVQITQSQPSNAQYQIFDTKYGQRIYWKTPEGRNELFNELLTHRLYMELGANVTPTFIVFNGSTVGVGSLQLDSIPLADNKYDSLVSSTAGMPLVSLWVYNFWIANNDWEHRSKVSSYALSYNTNGTIRHVTAFDFGHTFLGPLTQTDEEMNNELSSRTGNLRIKWNNSYYDSFGIESVFKFPNEFVIALQRVESIKDIHLYRVAMSVVRLLSREFNDQRITQYYRQLAYKTVRLLISRKKQLRSWIRTYLEEIVLSSTGQNLYPVYKLI